MKGNHDTRVRNVALLRRIRISNLTTGTMNDFAKVCNLVILEDSDDKICMMMTRLACNRAIESSYWRMDNDSDVGLLMGYVLYRLPVELEFMDLDTFPC
jgi:hypothetical protein